MSAYKEFDSIKFLNADCLVAALKELGFQPEVGATLGLYGYKGDLRPEVAQIVIRRQQIGAMSNDVGFRWAGQGFIPIVSEFDSGRFNETWFSRLQEAYAKHAVLKFVQQKRGRVLQAGQVEGGFALRIRMEV